ncbi:MAG TPA: DEAD/DEAH box helicase [Caulobacteraceae bacterium]
MTEFSELGLSPTTLTAVVSAGYTTATPIQAQAIPYALHGRDVLGIAQTGTGKTAAFTLPMIDRLQSGRARANMPRALVLAPTRELADQVAEAFGKYAKGTKLTWALLIGGVSMGDQLAALNKGVDVIIATPGRLLDLFERGKLLLIGVQIMVVDEADRMLDMGFIPDLERIFKLTPPKKQTLFFSATMPPEITRLTKTFLKDPERVEASRPAETAETITQYIAEIPSSDPKAKRLALRALIESREVVNGIVFCNRKSEVDVVAKSLKVHGFDAAPIHGDLDQSLRMKTLTAFRNGELKLLVASDVAARGLDIPAVGQVYNYDVPHHADDYVHRIGRTGRAGRSGEAFMIITPNDSKALDKVLKLINKTPEKIVLDLDWASAKTDPARMARDKAARTTARRGADRDRPRPIAAHGETASTRPIDTPSPRPRAEPDAAPSIPLDPVAASPAPVSERPARSRRRRGGGERHEGGEAVEAQAPIAVAEPQAERAPRERREPRESREPRRASRAERETRETPREPARPAGRTDGSAAFGSDTPAFLLRRAPMAKAAAED